MNEHQFIKAIIEWLAPLAPGCMIAMKKSVLYALPFDDHGKLQLGINDAGEPVRGRGLGFEQDILVFERLPPGDTDTSIIRTSIIPRVIAEVKLDSVSTHDAIVYSEKARRIRAIYPFVRYGLILGRMTRIPARVLRLGQEFDFILTVSHPTPQSEIETVRKLFREELEASKSLAMMLSGQKSVKMLHRSLKLAFEAH